MPVLIVAGLLIDFYMKNCRLNPIYRANCNSFVLNWLQEQSACHIGVNTSLIDSYLFMFHFISTQLLNMYSLTFIVYCTRCDPEHTPDHHHTPPVA